MKKIYICNLKELNQKKSLIKWIDEIKDEVIVFYNSQNELKVFSSVCPHFGGELIFDQKENNLRCKWHGWKFNISNGNCINNITRIKLREIKFEIDPNPIKQYKNHVSENSVYLIL